MALVHGESQGSTECLAELRTTSTTLEFCSEFCPLGGLHHRFGRLPGGNLKQQTRCAWAAGGFYTSARSIQSPCSAHAHDRSAQNQVPGSPETQMRPRDEAEETQAALGLGNRKELPDFPPADRHLLCKESSLAPLLELRPTARQAQRTQLRSRRKEPAVPRFTALSRALPTPRRTSKERRELLPVAGHTGPRHPLKASLHCLFQQHPAG